MNQSKWHWMLLATLVGLATVVGGCVRSSDRGVRPENGGQEARTRPDPQRFMTNARAAASIGDYVRAGQYLELALQYGASEATVLPLLIDACIVDQRFREAISHLEHHLSRHPRQHQARFVLAGLLSAVGQLDLATEQFKRLLRDRPGDAEAHYALAVVLRDGVGDRGQADQHFREYLRLRPSGSHAEQAQDSLLEQVR